MQWIWPLDAALDVTFAERVLRILEFSFVRSVFAEDFPAQLLMNKDFYGTQQRKNIQTATLKTILLAEFLSEKRLEWLN